MREITAQRPLPELVYESLVDAICTGSLASGERITQDGVAERLNVSRLPVGQALQRLRSEGFLIEAGRRGLKVAPLAVDMVREVYEFRAGVDQIAAGLAARRAGPTARAQGERILQRGREAARAHDVGRLVAADTEFHRFLYDLAGNAMIRDLMSSQWNHVRRIMLNILGERRNQEAIWREHGTILEAICAGDAGAAERLARAHVENASVWLQEAMAEQGEQATEAG